MKPIATLAILSILSGFGYAFAKPPHAPPGADYPQDPPAVLINGGTRSGKESLAFLFRKSGRARLFGSTTSGSFSGRLGAFADRNVNYLPYLAVQEMRLDGTAIEGVGVEPDSFVNDSGENDPPLLAVLKHLGFDTAMERTAGDR